MDADISKNRVAFIFEASSFKDIEPMPTEDIGSTEAAGTTNQGHSMTRQKRGVLD